MPDANMSAGEDSGVVTLGVTVIVPAKVLVTDPDPPGANAASTV